MSRAFLLLFILLCSGPLAGAESIQLKEINIYDQPERAHLQLIFSQDYKQSSSFLLEQGWMQIILPKVSFKDALANKRINDGFLKGYRLKREGDNAILEIQFSDPKFRSEGLVKDQAEFESYHLLIYKNPKAMQPQGAATSEKVGKEPKPKLFWNPETQAQTDLDTDSIVEMLLALLLVLLLFYVLLLLYNKYFVRRLNLHRGKYSLRVTSNYHLSPKQKIAIIEVNDMAFAVGITPNQINVISKVSDDGFINHLSKLNLKREENVDFARLRDEYLTQRQEEVKPPAVESFTHEFIKKVKGLKTID